MASVTYKARYTYAHAATGIDYLAEAELKLGDQHPLHVHRQTQVLWLVDGEVRVMLEEERRVVELAPGGLCRIPAGVLHAASRGRDSAAARVLDLRVGATGEIPRYVTEMEGGPAFEVEARATAAAVVALRVATRAASGVAAVQAAVWGLLAATRVTARPGAADVERPDRRLEIAESFMLARLAHPIGVRDVAAAFQLSPSQLTRLFARASTTPADRLRDLRVDHARRLLRETTLSIKQVAAACGFVCPNHFSRVYHDRTGVRPSADRG